MTDTTGGVSAVRDYKFDEKAIHDTRSKYIVLAAIVVIIRILIVLFIRPDRYTQINILIFEAVGTAIPFALGIAIVFYITERQMRSLIIQYDGVVINFVDQSGRIVVAPSDIEWIEDDNSGLVLVRKSGYSKLRIASSMESFKELRDILITLAPVRPRNRWQSIAGIVKVLLFVGSVLLICQASQWPLTLLGVFVLIGFAYMFRDEVFADTGIYPESRRNFTALAIGFLVVCGLLSTCGQIYYQVY
jgi:hypothetical protein